MSESLKKLEKKASKAERRLNPRKAAAFLAKALGEGQPSSAENF